MTRPRLNLLCSMVWPAYPAVDHSGDLDGRHGYTTIAERSPGHLVDN